PVVLEDVAVDGDRAGPGGYPRLAAGFREGHRGHRGVVAVRRGRPSGDDGVAAPQGGAQDQGGAGLVEHRLAVVVLDQVAVDEEVVVVGVGPEPGAVVVVDPVAAHVGAVDRPELHAAGAPAAGQRRLPVVGVVADDLVAHQHKPGDAGAGLVG